MGGSCRGSEAASVPADGRRQRWGGGLDVRPPLAPGGGNPAPSGLPCELKRSTL